jgi:hypothetical protein
MGNISGKNSDSSEIIFLFGFVNTIICVDTPYAINLQAQIIVLMESNNTSCPTQNMTLRYNIFNKIIFLVLRCGGNNRHI